MRFRKSIVWALLLAIAAAAPVVCSRPFFKSRTEAYDAPVLFVGQGWPCLPAAHRSTR